jgi:transcriptional regulator with XRE-family HTH domain
MRTFLAELMEESQAPAISQRLKATRERLKAKWAAENPGEPDNPFTQEEIARRIGVTLGAYGGWENKKEPSLMRLRQAALAFGLDEDYFSPTGDLATATARVEAEADRFGAVIDQVEAFLAMLKSQLGVEPVEPPPDEHEQ